LFPIIRPFSQIKQHKPFEFYITGSDFSLLLGCFYVKKSRIADVLSSLFQISDGNTFEMITLNAPVETMPMTVSDETPCEPSGLNKRVGINIKQLGKIFEFIQKRYSTFGSDTLLVLLPAFFRLNWMTCPWLRLMIQMIQTGVRPAQRDHLSPQLHPR